MKHTLLPIFVAFLVVSTSLLLLLHPAKTRAGCCAPSTETILDVGADDANVPTNARIRVEYLATMNQTCNGDMLLAAMQTPCLCHLEGPDGEVVDGEWTRV